MDKIIYVVTWHTESCDRGVDGYWNYKPSKKELNQFFKNNYPDEFFDGEIYIYWELHKLEAIRS